MGQTITFVGIGRGEDDFGKLAVTGINSKQEIALCRPGGQAGSRGRALGEVNNDRGLKHSGKRDAFLHQGKAPAGSAGHGFGTGERGASDHIDGADLVFGLADKIAELDLMSGHKVKQWGTGGHRVAGVEIDTGGNRP